ncbi:hypothetical protein Ddc_23263 [Ditylenchus destructor]|nr:hypothetical protein Ddc_23263 [Ditylenchus destructor]
MPNARLFSGFRILLFLTIIFISSDVIHATCGLHRRLAQIISHLGKRGKGTIEKSPLENRFRAMKNPAVSIVPTLVGQKLPPLPPKNKIPVYIYNDTSDTDDHHQLWEYLHYHHGPLAADNRLIMILTGRPAFIGYPIHVLTEMNSLKDKGFVEDFLLRTPFWDSHILKAANSSWQNGCRDWRLIGGPMYSQALLEDTSLVMQSIALSKILLIAELTGMEPSVVMQYVDIYDGGTPDLNPNDFGIFTTAIGHRPHVFCYMNYDSNGNVQSADGYAKEYPVLMNLEQYPIVYNENNINESAYDIETDGGKTYKIHNLEKDENLAGRRTHIREWLKNKMNTIIEKKQLKGIHMKSIDDFKRYLDQPALKQFDAMIMGPFTAAAETFFGTKGMERLKKMRYAYLMAFTQHQQTFARDYNLWVDFQSSVIFFDTVKKLHETQNWPVLFSVPAELAKSKDENLSNKMYALHEKSLSSGVKGADVIRRAYDQYTYAKGIKPTPQHDQNVNYLFYFVNQAKKIGDDEHNLLVDHSKMTCERGTIAKDYFKIEKMVVDLDLDNEQLTKFDLKKDAGAAKKFIHVNVMYHKTAQLL